MSLTSDSHSMACLYGTLPLKHTEHLLLFGIHSAAGPSLLHGTSAPAPQLSDAWTPLLLRSTLACNQVKCTTRSLLELAGISQLTTLTHLAFGGDRVVFTRGRSSQLNVLTPLKQLQRLELSSCSMIAGRDTAAVLAGFTQLTSLNLADSALSLGFIEALGSCSSLVSNSSRDWESCSCRATCSVSAVRSSMLSQ
jgi:hypothetical protein